VTRIDITDGVANLGFELNTPAKVKMNVLPITAIVVGRNEGYLLERCLGGLNFCEDIRYVDLESSDGSLTTALESGASVESHALVPMVEIILSELCNTTRHPWILFTDPDEYVDPALATQLIEVFPHLIQTSQVGCVIVPCRFYFKGRALRGTPWGGPNRRVLLANRAGFEFTPQVHSGKKLREGFVSLDIEPNGDNCVHHYWMESWRQLLEKHQRYLLLEGRSRHERSRPIRLSTLLLSPAKEFLVSYVKCRGYRDGMTGILLSLFWAWYQSAAKAEHYKFQRKNS
jgi:hypothetical protein